MKHTKEALKYGITTLGISPNELFKLIESSKEYEGDDYKRWLASQIIKIAEKDGVGYSQLLVKKFNILQDMLEDEDATLKENWVNFLKTQGDYIIGFDEISDDLDIEDWFSGIDLGEDNSFFLEENSEDLYNKFVSKSPVKLLARLSSNCPNSSKSSELYLNAKSRNIDCPSEDSLFLYRMCSFVEAFFLGEEFEFKFLTDINFLLDSENSCIWRYFLEYFNVTGYMVQAKDLFNDTLGGINYAYVKCTPRVNTEIQSYIELQPMKLNGELALELDQGKCIRCTHSKEDLLHYIQNSQESKELKPINTEDLSGTVMSLDAALAYLNYSHSRGVWVSGAPTGDLSECTPITEENLEDCIIYFSVSSALKLFNVNESIKIPVNGSPSYSKLLSNCIPLFIFSNRNLIKQESNSSVNYLDLYESLIRDYEVDFSFEAKELVDLCLEDYKVGIRDDLTFNTLRQSREDTEFDNMYLSCLRNLSDYIRGIYKEVC